ASAGGGDDQQQRQSVPQDSPLGPKVGVDPSRAETEAWHQGGAPTAAAPGRRYRTVLNVRSSRLARALVLENIRRRGHEKFIRLSASRSRICSGAERPKRRPASDKSFDPYLT